MIKGRPILMSLILPLDLRYFGLQTDMAWVLLTQGVDIRFRPGEVSEGSKPIAGGDSTGIRTE